MEKDDPNKQALSATGGFGNRTNPTLDDEGATAPETSRSRTSTAEGRPSPPNGGGGGNYDRDDRGDGDRRTRSQSSSAALTSRDNRGLGPIIYIPNHLPFPLCAGNLDTNDGSSHHGDDEGSAYGGGGGGGSYNYQYSPQQNHRDDQPHGSGSNCGPPPSHQHGGNDHLYGDEEQQQQRSVSVVVPTRMSSHNSKYDQYCLLVDHDQDDKAVEIALCSNRRPHMRGFHCAWTSFFVAFFSWFAIAPLLSEVKTSLCLTNEQIWTSNVLSVTGSAILRVIIGPFCDKYGARMCSVAILVVSALPTMALGLVHDTTSLGVLRLIIGFGGATFVTCQYWTSSMFTREVAGTANALVAGWGNLGGGVTNLIMGSVLFPLFKKIFNETGYDADDFDRLCGGVDVDVDVGVNDSTNAVSNAGQSLVSHNVLQNEMAWRTVCVVPGLISLFTAYSFLFHSDDSPKGNYHKRKKQGYISDVNVWAALRTSFQDFNTWLLFLQYGCCFGVEITVSNAAALYYKDNFGLTTEAAAAIASIFGWMNLFARGLGGFLSDMCNAWDGMRGRLAWQSTCLLCEGLAILLFSYSENLLSSILSMALFSLFVQATEGSTFGIVPYVNPQITGSIVGVVGAGGNVGGIFFGLIFRHYDTNARKAFTLMGLCVMVSSILSAFVRIRGHAGLVCGKDAPEVRTGLRHRQRDHHRAPPPPPQRRVEELEASPVLDGKRDCSDNFGIHPDAFTAVPRQTGDNDDDDDDNRLMSKNNDDEDEPSVSRTSVVGEAALAMHLRRPSVEFDPDDDDLFDTSASSATSAPFSVAEIQVVAGSAVGSEYDTSDFEDGSLVARSVGGVTSASEASRSSRQLIRTRRTREAVVTEETANDDDDDDDDDNERMDTAEIVALAEHRFGSRLKAAATAAMSSAPASAIAESKPLEQSPSSDGCGDGNHDQVEHSNLSNTTNNSSNVLGERFSLDQLDNLPMRLSNSPHSSTVTT